MSQLPRTDRVIGYLDVQALRRAGVLKLLTGDKPVEEPEYRQFVAETGFDYRSNLDAVFVSYSRQETHLWLEGRFDFSRLVAYVKQHGGSCPDHCRIESSTPGRRISFFRLRAHTLAMASSPDPDAVNKLLERPVTEPLGETPRQPVWFLLPPSALRDESLLPAATRTFADALSQADRVYLAFGPKGERFEAFLEARCRNDEQAAQAARELQAATTLLNRMLRRQNQTPDARDLSGVLTRGEFQAEGAKLRGVWPLERMFIESLAGGAP
ncbi:MAG: hypothetical protein HY235_06115 [Acidobacteria bacterium]|nr:hypothetical protein [Acidobacteriota bacterium]